MLWVWDSELNLESWGKIWSPEPFLQGQKRIRKIPQTNLKHQAEFAWRLTSAWKWRCPSLSLVSPSRSIAGLGGDPRVLEKQALFRERRALESSAVSRPSRGCFWTSNWGEITFLRPCFQPGWISWYLLYVCGEGNGNPLQFFCLENPMDGGAW